MTDQNPDYEIDVMEEFDECVENDVFEVITKEHLKQFSSGEDACGCKKDADTMKLIGHQQVGTEEYSTA